MIIIKFISWVSTTFLLDMLVAAGFCQCTSTVLLVTTLYLYYLLCSERFKSYISICSLTILCTIAFLPSLNFISALFSWISHLNLNLLARVPEVLSSVTFLPRSIFLSASILLVCGLLAFRGCCLHVCVSGNFSNRWGSLYSSSTRRRPYPSP